MYGLLTGQDKPLTHYAKFDDPGYLLFMVGAGGTARTARTAASGVGSLVRLLRTCCSWEVRTAAAQLAAARRRQPRAVPHSPAPPPLQGDDHPGAAASGVKERIQARGGVRGGWTGRLSQLLRLSRPIVSTAGRAWYTHTCAPCGLLVRHNRPAGVQQLGLHC